MDMRFEQLCGAFPLGGRAGTDWEGLSRSALASLLEDMAHTPQEPAWHGEGDVLTHTKLTCKVLASGDSWRALTERQQQAAFLAALLHDVGKPSCTRNEDGRLVSPGHARAGASITRSLLWHELGLCGSREAADMRETVCSLVRWHTLPLHILEHAEPDRELLKLASIGESAGSFTLELLYLLAEADIRGRETPDKARLLEQLQLFALASREAGCFAAPYTFPDATSRYFYLSGHGSLPGQSAYDASWGQVTILSGLPGTGKDTYISRKLAESPVISLDAIRRALGVLPGAPQGKVISEAEEKARELLRAHKPFVLNATNLSETLRGKWCALFHGYGASVRIVYLETDEPTRLRRNRDRQCAVPEAAVTEMLRRLTPPMPWEAENIDWVFV